jgi:hypothetical protein
MGEAQDNKQSMHAVTPHEYDEHSMRTVTVIFFLRKMLPVFLTGRTFVK